MAMGEIAERLRTAREGAGFRTASDAARHIGVNPVTYTAHENGGREYDRRAALLYGKEFAVDPAWLLFGDNRRVADVALRREQVREIDMKKVDTGVIALLNGEEADSPQIRCVWQMPDNFLAEQLHVCPRSAWIIEVQGDSMYDPDTPGAPGSLFPGDRVIVDSSDNRPSPLGPSQFMTASES